MKTKLLLPPFLVLGLVMNSFSEEPVVKEHPQITVYVGGAVKKPSSIILPKGATVLDALAAVGDATEFANLHRVKVLRKPVANEATMINVDVTDILNGKAPNVFLQGSDHVVVPERAGSWKY